ncbi:hypothetical protein SGRA_3841 [Saprospira grandis str. Lewin]|uniref:Uncharacterized protein n=1 Tax=Saprospira grandis (strain Lewin) TaxID=984262 RepID=H6L5Z7_SAPGL|nr:hypothetical protein SGRA_3841 [Saprospira grandis str. Lewin]
MRSSAAKRQTEAAGRRAEQACELRSVAAGEARGPQKKHKNFRPNIVSFSGN